MYNTSIISIFSLFCVFILAHFFFFFEHMYMHTHNYIFNYKISYVYINLCTYMPKHSLLLFPFPVYLYLPSYSLRQLALSLPLLCHPPAPIVALRVFLFGVLLLVRFFFLLSILLQKRNKQKIYLY